MRVEEWRSQSKRGTLELCILLMIEKRERYGYELISELEKRPVLAAKESTIYPLLRRLLGGAAVLLLAGIRRGTAAQEVLQPHQYGPGLFTDHQRRVGGLVCGDSGDKGGITCDGQGIRELSGSG